MSFKSRILLDSHALLKMVKSITIELTNKNDVAKTHGSRIANRGAVSKEGAVCMQRSGCTHQMSPVFLTECLHSPGFIAGGMSVHSRTSPTSRSLLNPTQPTQ